MVKKILIAPDSMLLVKSKPIKVIDKRISKIVVDLTDTLLAQHEPLGVGLSSNQIGILERIFVMKPEEDSAVQAFINPEVVRVQEGAPNRKPILEGCLSIPEVWGHVLRPARVKIQYMRPDGSTVTSWFENFEGVVAQHELDHLNGILFTQRVLEQGRELLKEIEGELESYAL